MMSDDTENVIILDIENSLIKCKKEDLTTHSDYFKAMFDGNFIERDQKQIKIEGIKPRAMNIILILLWDETNLIDEKDTLPVLQAACMLQFDKIRNICLERLNEMLRLDNCIKIWMVTEQLSIKPIYLKAKLIALQEFMEIKDSESLQEFTLDQILDYLGNIFLKTQSEIIVFQICMKWWYDQSEYFIHESTEVLLKLLSCLDFNSINIANIDEMMVYPDINSNDEIVEILMTVKKLKRGEELSEMNDYVEERAKSLCQSKSRLSPCYPAILVYANQLMDSRYTFPPNIFIDNFKRKRMLLHLLYSGHQNLMAVYYDETLQKFKKLFVIDENKCEDLEGFEITGYKELVFLYGGQHLIGKGEWNVNFWVYDSVRERWERKSRLPHCRRHFESCIVGHKIFVAGGIGNYRIIQDNVFYYDYKMDTWSNVRTLPQMKCCSFLNKCFFFSAAQKCGYFWDVDSQCQDIINVDVLVEDEILKRQSEYAIFAYKDAFYVKGKELLELEMENNKLVLKSVFPVTNLDYDKMEITVCNDVVYSFYKYKNEEGTSMYSLEVLNLQTRRINFIFKDLSEKTQIGESRDETFILNPKCKIFTITHHSLVEKNTVINNSFRKK